MKNPLDKIDRAKTLSYIIVACSGVLFYMLLQHFDSVWYMISQLVSFISPFLLGAVIAYLLNPLANFFERRLLGGMKNRRAAHSLGVVLCVLFALTVFALLIYAIVPQMASSLSALVKNMDGYFATLRGWLDNLNESYDFITIDTEALVGPWDTILKTAATWIQNNIDNILGTSVRVGSGLIAGIIAFVISIYMLLDKHNLKRGVQRFAAACISEPRRSRMADLAARSDGIFMRYLGYNLLDALIIGVANFIVMLITGMPYALLISVIVGVTNFIPTFGPIIGAVPSALLILLIDPWSALWFVVLCFALQGIDGNVIKPLLFGDSTGLAPVWVLVSIVVGGRMFGVIGMILGVPVFAIIASMVNEALEKRETALGIEPPPAASPKKEKKIEKKIREHMEKLSSQDEEDTKE